MILVPFPTSLTLLAACGGAHEKDGHAPMPPRPRPPRPMRRACDPRRAGESRNVRRRPHRIARGTDLNAFCAAARSTDADRGGERDAMEACAAEMGIHRGPLKPSMTYC